MYGGGVASPAYSCVPASGLDQTPRVGSLTVRSLRRPTSPAYSAALASGINQYPRTDSLIVRIPRRSYLAGVLVRCGVLTQSSASGRVPHRFFSTQAYESCLWRAVPSTRPRLRLEPRFTREGRARRLACSLVSPARTIRLAYQSCLWRPVSKLLQTATALSSTGLTLPVPTQTRRRASTAPGKPHPRRAASGRTRRPPAAPAARRLRELTRRRKRRTSHPLLRLTRRSRRRRAENLLPHP